MSIIRITGGVHKTEIEKGWTVYTDNFEANAGRFSHFKADGETNFGTPQKAEVSDNDFIPIVTLDKNYNTKAKYLGNADNKKIILSDYLDNRQQLLEVIKITIPSIIRLRMNRGNKKANDNKGNITIISNGVKLITDTDKYIHTSIDKKTNRIISKTIYEDLDYDKNKFFRIKITPEDIQDDAYIDFYANDNDWFFKSVSDVHCGRIAIVNTSKVGRKITKHIENLPKAPSSYKKPPLWNNPKESFAVANQYQDCGGMCYAVSMARVDKAYKDMGINSAIQVENKGDDYIYSGTISKSIPDQYFGYGVGGALAKNGYSELLSHEDVLAGKLEEGAMLQYWNNNNKIPWTDLKSAIKYSIGKSISQRHPNFEGGHSVVFKSYIFDKNDKIIGIKYYDYNGVKHFDNDKIQRKIFLGANLKDKK